MPSDLSPLHPDYILKCECVMKRMTWPNFVRCGNNATVRITGGTHEGHLMCHGHWLEWREEAEADGYEELDISDA